MSESMFFAPIEFTHDGLTIRLYRLEDVPKITEAVLESYEHLKPWMPWAKPDVTEADYGRAIRDSISKYMAGTEFILGIFEGEDFVGGTGFHMRCGPMAWKATEIGMWIRANRSGQGYGTRALKMMLEWGFGEWGWERIIWKCDTLNVPSLRTAERAGMQLEATFLSCAVGVDGTRRDMHQLFALRASY